MSETQIVGRSLPRVDALAKVRGAAEFPGDLSMPEMLHMKVLFSGRPHALIRHIETAKALASPGVVAVLTARDVPVNNYGISESDQPVLCDRVVRFEGDRVALIIAEDEKAADMGRSLVEVEYQDLPVVESVEKALADGAELVHDEKGSNLLALFRVRKGDVEAGLAGADVVLEGVYEIGGQEHAYMQPDAGLAYLDDDGNLVVKTAGQWAHDDRRQIARSLDLPEERVRVIYAYVGGAFGGREDVSVQILVALGALKTRRPVKLVWNRYETTIGHHKRHPMTIRNKWGAMRDGRIVAQEIDILADAGAYASTSAYVVNSTVLVCTGPYDVPNVKVDARAVYTNNPPSGAFRGFGVPQGVLAAETQMARLAEKLGMDPVEIRLHNFLSAGSVTHLMSEMPAGLSARETLKAAAGAIGWWNSSGRWTRPRVERQPMPKIMRGIGIAAGWKNVGYTFGYPEQATTLIELHGAADIERAVVRLPAAEVGQGIHTTIAQMASEALGVSPERIEVIYTDTSQTPSAGSVSASRMAYMAGNALRDAGRAALEAWHNEQRPAIASRTFKPPATEAMDPVTGRANGVFAFAYLAQAVEVEVDSSTGQVRVTRIVSAHDVGRAINPQIVEGQIQGGAIQALGWATMEDFIVQHGLVATPTFSTYLIPTVLDVPPDFESLVLEEPLPSGPWGATGVGEMSFLAIAPAILDAVHDATGIWFNRVPLTPERVLAGLAQGAQAFPASDHR
jgi:CO/xanthine dehydrogenase Mo-binding subunit